MACTDECHKEIPSERPTLWGSAAVRASVLAWAFALSALIAGWLGTKPLIQNLLYAGAIASGAFYFAREALSELVKEREVGVELLMTVAIIAAAALGRWREAALVACLYSISEAMEGFTIQRTRYAIRALMDLVPPKARVLRGGAELEVDVKEVSVGERIQVRPGGSIPVDGIVREGASAIDESPITGESMPVERAAGASVFAGVDGSSLRARGGLPGRSRGLRKKIASRNAGSAVSSCAAGSSLPRLGGLLSCSGHGPPSHRRRAPGALRGGALPGARERHAHERHAHERHAHERHAGLLHRRSGARAARRRVGGRRGGCPARACGHAASAARVARRRALAPHVLRAVPRAEHGGLAARAARAGARGGGGGRARSFVAARSPPAAPRRARSRGP